MSKQTEHNDEVSNRGPAFEVSDRRVDARGLMCPEPLVLCKKAMAELVSGNTVHVLASDPHAEIDFEVFARRTRNRLLRQEWLDGTYHVLVQKG